MNELEGLIRDGTFVEVKDAVLEGSPRIFGSRFVDELKNVGRNLNERSTWWYKTMRKKVRHKLKPRIQPCSASCNAGPFS